jgi:hypothetical protein
MRSVRFSPRSAAVMKSSSETMLFDVRRLFAFAIETLTALRDLARFHRVFDDDELIARHRNSADARDLNGNRRTCFLDDLSALVEQRAHAAEYMPQMKSSPTCSVPPCTRTVATGPLPWIELSLNDCTGGALVGVRHEVEDFRLKENLLEKLVDVGSLLAEISEEAWYRRTPRERLRAEGDPASPFPGFAAKIDLVDSNDHRHAGVLRVARSLRCLRHDLIRQRGLREQRCR